MTKGNRSCVTRETVYDRCAYVGCYNGKFINGRRLFHFPSETDRRLEMWIERSGNFRLRTWAATSLRKAGLCGDHFDEKCFTNATRKALRRNVVPRHYTEDRKFRKSNGESTTENNENNENNKNETATEEDEDDPLNCDTLLSNPVESSARVQTNETNEGTSSLPSVEFTIGQTNIKNDGNRTPSPIVEFIVEELDETLIYGDSCRSEHSCSPKPEASVDDSLLEYEEKVNLQNDQSHEQSTSMLLEHTEKSTIPGAIGLRVNRSDPEVRTYYRSKNHRQPKLELVSGESEAITDEELSVPIETNLQLNPQLDTQLNLELNPQLDTQLNLELNPQLDTQLNLELNPQLNSELSPQLNSQLNLQLNPQLNSQLHPQLNTFKPRSNNIGYVNKRTEKMLTTYRDENKQLRKTMRMLKQKVRRAKAREVNYMKVREMLKNVDEFLNIHECTNPVARAMVKIALHKRNAPYTKEEKDFATQLYRYSSTAFDRLRSSGCNFPGKSTIRRWITENDGEPSACDFLVAVEAEENEERLIEDFQEIDHDEMIEEVEEMGGEMEEAVEDAEDAIDDLVERLEEQIEDADGHEEYVEEIPPDEEDEEDFK